MQALDLIGVAGFASVWMLAWGAAASIPIVLHLLNRRRQQTVSWAAMRLLLQAIEKQSKRVRIEQLILLAIRTAILIVLAIALARPFFAPDSNLASIDAQRAPRLWIFVLDNSYSMGYRDEQELDSLRRKRGASNLFVQPSMAMHSRLSRFLNLPKRFCCVLRSTVAAFKPRFKNCNSPTPEPI